MEIFGKRIGEENIDLIRKDIALVSQDTYLFPETIAWNVACGDESVSMERIIECCKKARIHDDIMKMPQGYNTDAGERGNMLSGGQKQRLCIARALLKKPKILILDDSTSAVDTKTDALIRKAFREEIPDTTKIIIAQRVSSVEDADMIIVMENGKVNGVGTSEELLKTNAIYREVYESQVKGGEDYE